MAVFTLAYLLVIIALMGFPVVAGIILIIASRGRGLGYPACGVCKYDLSATIGAASRCPECGAEFAQVGILPPRGRRKPLLLWAGILLLMAPSSCVGIGLLRFSQQRMSQARQATIAAQQAAAGAQAASASAASAPASPSSNP